MRRLKEELDSKWYRSKRRKHGVGGQTFSRGALYNLLRNCLYIGMVRHKKKTYAGNHNSIVDKTIYEQAQAQLESNRSRAKNRSAAKAPSLLAGLLFDSRGNPMSPTHATKGIKRYRYYISQAILKYETDKCGSVTRVPAESIEGVCQDVIKEFLSNAVALLGVMGSLRLSADQMECLVQRAQALARKWISANTAKQIGRISQLIQRVDIHRHKVLVHIKVEQLAEILLPDLERPEMLGATPDLTHTLSCPVNLKRCGIETRLIASTGQQKRTHQESIAAVQKALTRALEWDQALRKGSVATIAELAQKEEIQQRYICTILKLVNLNPAIQESIAAGKIPDRLTLDRLKRGFSHDWKSQNRALGFLSDKNLIG